MVSWNMERRQVTDLQHPKAHLLPWDHTVAVTNLTPGTAYHYRIVAEDESGNVSYSKDRTFEMALEVVAIDNVPPEITEVSATNVTASGATINWITDELAQGHVEYGKTAEYGASSPLASDYATEHSAAISGVDPHTEYHFELSCRTSLTMRQFLLMRFLSLMT